jgi:hypothetical protein
MTWIGLVCSSIAFCCWPARATTYTAASDSQADVQTAVNLTSNGDTVQIPCSGTQSVTWTAAVNVVTYITITALGATPNTGPSTFGAGTNCLTILDNNTTNTTASGIFAASLTYTSSSNVFTLQNMTLEPASTSSSIVTPIWVLGTCTSGGCPNMRLDNFIFDGWGNNTQDQASWMVRADNMFGVLDHDTLTTADTEVQALVNVNNSGWAGVGQFGDNSWANTDSFGTANELYLENDIDQGNGWGLTDCDESAGDQLKGGCRYVGRFNQFPIAGGDSFGNHGTETSGRMRGGKSQEIYNNSMTCLATGGACSSGVGFRSADGFVFDNTFVVGPGSEWGQVAGLSAYRTWLYEAPWEACDGRGPWDTNDGATQTSASTITSTGSSTLTDTSQSWATNQYAPGSNYYSVYDATNGAEAGIVSNTAHTLTTISSIGGSTGDTYYILGTTLYEMGTVTSVVIAVNYSTITDTSKTWITNQWAVNGDPYSLIDISIPQSGWEIQGSTSDTVFSISGNKTPVVNSGDTYIILRASVCLDQPARGAGSYISGDLSETTSPTPVGPVNEALVPIYEWGDTITGGSFAVGPIVSSTAKLIVNRDWYQETQNQGAQTTSSSPFNGTTTTNCGGAWACGVGHGTLANRPTTCTTGVGYWATDQGNWNQSGSGGQGELYVCTATNTWTMKYEPYTYPHPLITGGTSGSGVTPPNPPTDPTATVQ